MAQKKKRATRKMLNELFNAIKTRNKQEIINSINNFDSVDWTLHTFKYQEQFEVLEDKANELLKVL